VSICRARCLLAAALAALLAGCSASRDSPSRPVPQVVPEILRELPHDTLAFTQGLLYDGGKLYESTGAPGGRVSSLRVVNPASGAVSGIQPVPDVFAEGIAVLGEQLVQLTWRNGIAFVYSFPALRRTDEVFEYGGEGWGLASDGRQFYMSDGSDTLRVLDAAFGLRKKLPVRMAGRPVRSLNELECARGRLYANIWYSAIIVEIDPRSGAVTRTIDCAQLQRRAAPASIDDVLNGIAYNPARDVFFLTGKNWRVMFEVRIPAETAGTPSRAPTAPGQ